jgi:hypothetical protein
MPSLDIDLASDIDDALDDIDDLIEQSTKGVRDGINRSAFRGAQIATRNAPKDHGLLQSTIDVGKQATTRDLEAKVKAGSPKTRDEGFDYAIAMEFGTDPHTITPDEKDALAFEVGGEQVVVGKVEHPGTDGFGYMQKAADRIQSQIPGNIREQVNERIE